MNVTRCCMYCNQPVYRTVAHDWRAHGGASGGDCPKAPTRPTRGDISRWASTHQPVDLDDLASIEIWLAS